MLSDCKLMQKIFKKLIENIKFLCKKAVKTNEINLKKNKTTLKINHSFTYCLKMNNFIAGPRLPGHFVKLKLGSDVPEHIAPLRR